MSFKTMKQLEAEAADSEITRHLPFDDEKTLKNNDRSLCRRRALLVSLLVIGSIFSGLARLGWLDHLQRSFVSFATSRSYGITTGHGIVPQINNENDTFDWYSHQPSTRLNWAECYGVFQCARLTVPLDYAVPSGEEAAVALIKFPSAFPVGHAQYRGPILFNPGGPGGSGIDTVKGRATRFRGILGDGFDLVGFDPRGVGRTTPHLGVFTTSIEAGSLLTQYEGSVNASPSALGRTYAFAQNLGSLALKRAEKVAQHVSTPVVARDMLSIITAAGQDKLQYWGFSYGTVLGATFASMFPDKVGRVIIDGVVDSENYYDGLWSNNLRDTDSVLDDIVQSCTSAGPEVCPLHESSVSGVRERINALLEKLRVAPLSVEAEDGSQVIVDYAVALQVIFRTLYQTHNNGAQLTRALAALESGDGFPIYNISMKREMNDLMSCACGPEPVPFTAPYDRLVAIACGDVDDRKETLDDLRAIYDEMAQTSRFAEVWPERAFCAGWKIRGKERFKGSFEHTTSFPLLLIGNVADPVTPLWNAHKMSKGFKDSVVLTQNSSGHCSSSATSLCTAKAIRNYFVDGTLPEKGTICDTESSIFGDVSDLDSMMLSEEDKELLEASKGLQESYPVPVLF